MHAKPWYFHHTGIKLKSGRYFQNCGTSVPNYTASLPRPLQSKFF
jgi:hypothetical protein